MSDFFKFDREHYAYVEIKKNFPYYLKKFLSYFIVSAIIAAGLVYLFFEVYDAPETLALKNQNLALAKAADSIKQATTQMEISLDSLKEQDRAIYRKILNADPIDEDSVARVQKDKNKNVNLEDLTARLEQMDKKMTESGQKQALLVELAEKNKEELKRIPSIRPVPTEVISGFGKRKHPISGQDKKHNGIDMKADVGTPVKATGDGVVYQAGTIKNGYGLYVSINHSYGYVTVYGNLSQLKVRKGQKVKRGDIIALSGNSGLSKGPHLHYEILKDNKPVDPIDYFYTDMSAELFQKYKEKAAQYNESMD